MKITRPVLVLVVNVRQQKKTTFAYREILAQVPQPIGGGGGAVVNVQATEENNLRAQRR